MSKTLPVLKYSLHELRRLCRQVTRVMPEIVLDRHRIHIHDIHPDYVPAGSPVHEHVHSFYEGHLFLDGGGVYVTGKEEAVGQGGALLHGPHAPHAWQAHDTACLRLLVWFSMEPMVPVTRPQDWPICPDLYQEITLLLDEAHAGLPGWHHRVTARTTIFLSRLFSIAGWPESPQPDPVPSTDLLTMIEQFFRDNLARPLALSDVTAHVGMSERSLCRQFLELTGETVMERLLNLRMAQAATLLADSEASLTVIGQQVGIPDPSYFCRRFRRHFNMTAAQYRHGVQSRLHI
ncbi:MAG TPA: helix-turn-helix transcriptional regulator [Armatimonadota bacterium]|jgi:AraC-like DNA-binding protein